MAPLPRLLAALTLLLTLAPGQSPPLRAQGGWTAKLDPLVGTRIHVGGRSRVIVRTPGAAAATSLVSQLPLLPGARVLRALPIVNGVTLELPNSLVPLLAANPLVSRVSLDRMVSGAMERTGATVGATAVRQELGSTAAASPLR